MLVCMVGSELSDFMKDVIYDNGHCRLPSLATHPFHEADKVVQPSLIFEGCTRHIRLDQDRLIMKRSSIFGKIDSRKSMKCCCPPV